MSNTNPYETLSVTKLSDADDKISSSSNITFMSRNKERH